MALHQGTNLGPYEVLAKLGEGGMGEVYQARDTRLGRIVAIKVLPSDLAADPGSRERFDREARIISSLSHRHICALYDVGRQVRALSLARSGRRTSWTCIRRSSAVGRDASSCSWRRLWPNFRWTGLPTVASCCM